MIEKFFVEFIEQHWDQTSPLVLGLSGGSDSLALFWLLCENKIPFHVAHINHKWRQESDREEKILSQLCAKERIPFHLKTLSGKEQANAEEAARQSRHQFFKEVVTATNALAVILGHHADDQAETVLKRLFEGASLTSLQGIWPCRHIEGIEMWRPLLKVRKEMIVEFLEKRGREFFSDSSNFDPQYLRARMRQEIFPFLSAKFGKNVTLNLCKVAEQGHELAQFCEELLALHPLNGEEENTLNLETFQFKSLFIRKFILRRFFREKGISLTDATIDTLLFHLSKKSVIKKILISNKWVAVSDNKVRILVNEEVKLFSAPPLKKKV